MGSPRVVVIANPKSQGGALGKRWPELADEIRRELPFEEALTTGPGDATRLARAAVRSGADIVVAVGGDGTINEVMNGWFEDGQPIATTTALGVLPFGTGGDFVRTVDIPKNFPKAVKVIAAGVRKRIDVGRLEFTLRTGGTGVRMFINIASFGMSGMTDRLVNESQKRLGGRLAFFTASARAMWGYTNQRVRMIFDERAADAVDLTINTVAVSNGRYFGGGMQIAPEAELDDGRFDVIALGDMGMADFVLRSRRLYAGTHLTMPKVSHRRAASVRAEPGDSQAIVELDVDGETPGILPATFTCVPRALDLIVPGAAAR